MEHKTEAGDKQCFKVEYIFLGSIFLILMVVYVEYNIPNYDMNAPAPAFSWNQVRCLRKCVWPFLFSCRNKRNEGSHPLQAISYNIGFFLSIFLTNFFCLDPPTIIFLTLGNDHTVIVQY